MTEPVSLATAKQQCRIAPSETAEEALISSYIVAAREWVEERSGLTLVRRSIVEHHAGFVPNLGTPFLDEASPCHAPLSGGAARLRAPIWLRSWPIATVDSVAYTDPDGIGQTLASTRAVIGAWPAKLHPPRDTDWPSISEAEGVDVTLTAGYADGQAPARAVQAMLLIIGHWFSTRETVITGVRAAAVSVPMAAEDLCDQLKLMRV